MFTDGNTCFRCRLKPRHQGCGSPCRVSPVPEGLRAAEMLL